MMHLFYLCIIIIKDDTNNMIQVNYFNGSYSRANKVSPKDFGQVGNAIIMASNEGWPFKANLMIWRETQSVISMGNWASR